MFKRLLNLVQEGNQFFGVDIITVNDRQVFNVVSVKRKGDEVNLITTASFETVEKAIKTIPKLSPVCLILRTDQVITKSTNITKTREKQIIKDLFPTVTDNDFYWEFLESKENVYGGICRKGIVDSIVSVFTSKKLFICSWSLGNICVETLPDMLNHEYKDLTSEDQILNSSGLIIEGRYIPAFSGALNLAGGYYPTENNYANEKEINRRNLWNHRYFKMGLTFSMTLVLVLLLCNFLAFTHYYNQVIDLQSLSKINTDQKESLMNLVKEVGKKEKMIEEVLRSSSSKSSYYMDQIAGGIPDNILLQRLEYQPALKAIKEDQPLTLNANHILIAGDYTDNLALSGWISDLESLEFVNKVTIINLEKNDNIPAFKLDIDLIGEE